MWANTGTMRCKDAFGTTKPAALANIGTVRLAVANRIAVLAALESIGIRARIDV